jgi:MFS family permease
MAEQTARDGEVSENRGVSASNSPVRTLLSNRSFLCIWAIGGLSGVVRWLQLLVLGIYTFQITGSPLLVSTIPMLLMLPLALFGPLVGVLADRFNRKIMISCTLGFMTALCITAAVLDGTQGLSYPNVAVIALLSGMFFATDMPVRRRLLGDLAGDSVPSAMGLDSATANVTRMAGPLLGGVMLELFSIGGVFVLSALFYAVCLLLVPLARLPDYPRVTSGTMFVHELVGGIKYVLGDDTLRRIFSITIIFNVFGFSFTSMVPIIGTGRLGLGPLMVGVMSSAEGMGAFSGAIVIAFVATRERFFQIYLWGTVAYITMVGYLGILCSVAGGPTHSVVVMATTLLTIGMAGSCFATMQGTLTYLSAPAEYRSRVLGVLALCIGTGPLGFFNVGWMAEAFGVPTALMISSAEGLTVLLLLWVYGKELTSVPGLQTTKMSPEATTKS